MPVAEHPFDGSWGYQVTGDFAPSSRFGSPLDFMALIDTLHQRGIGVIVDWVPAHFPTDEHALGYFDGTHLYEHNDPRQGFHPDWDTFIFNFGRPEVANFLIANALFWFDKYHIDGLRVDAVASMLYRDYSRKAGEWVPNQYGGRENLEAIALLKRVNEQVHAAFPDVLTIAEESTSWPMVSRPTYDGGLGFDFKWDMGWMHDTLSYFEQDPVHRKYHHNKLTFRGLYLFAENFVLPLSHDEVVYGKKSILNKMPGDTWQKFANVRLLYGYMFAQPGKKMLFMGDEFGQWKEWSHDSSLDWHLLDEPLHAGLKRWVRDLNTLYRGTPELHELDANPEGFRWINADDSEQSVLSMVRMGHSTSEMILFVANFTPIPRFNYWVGVPIEGRWTEILNSDAPLYGGSGMGNIGGASTNPVRMHGHDQSLNLTLPPLGIMAFRSPKG
jgi:1,4-alpha-glucan branching enzyme